jgi:hypothetical protein
MSLHVLWTARSNNRKTGNVPNAWIGLSREEAEDSCSGCSMLDTGCYAHHGSVLIGSMSVTRGAFKNPQNYTLDAALRMRHKKARMVRVTALGDIGRSGKDLADTLVAKVTESGLALVGYTHHWRESEVAHAWKGRLMASCDTLEDADRAMDEGWRAAAVVLSDHPRVSKTPRGRTVLVCPAQLKDDHSVTCNTCRLCDASARGPIIAFRAHGNDQRALELQLREERKKIELSDEIVERLRWMWPDFDPARVVFEMKPFDPSVPRSSTTGELRHPGRLRGWMRAIQQGRTNGWEPRAWRKCHTEHAWVWYNVLESGGEE